MHVLYRSTIKTIRAQMSVSSTVSRVYGDSMCNTDMCNTDIHIYGIDSPCPGTTANEPKVTGTMVDHSKCTHTSHETGTMQPNQ